MPTDTEMLDWVIFYSAKISHSNDAEFSYVTWYSHKTGQVESTDGHHTARQAIIFAMKQEN